MKRTSTLVFLYLTFFNFSNLHGQGLEVGIFFGISHYQGDLQRSHVEILEAHHGNGLFARYSFNNKIAVKGHFYQGSISGSDANYSNLPSIRGRNLSFRSPIKELGIQLEYTYLKFGETKKHWQKNKIGYKYGAYFFAGVGGFHFNPQAYYQNEWHDLQPLGTEGQGLPGNPAKYDRIALAIPVGIGGKFNITHWSSVGFEIGFRKTFTDHIDDVSGLYPDLKALGESNPLAATLSYRSTEYNSDLQNDPSGSARGSVAWDDSYIFAGVTAAIRLSK